MTALQRIDKLLAALNVSSKPNNDTNDDNKQSDNMEKVRITPEILSKCIDLNKYGDKKKYPYIRILPTTKPSRKFLIFDNTLMANKQKFLSQYKMNPNISAFFKSVDDISDSAFKPLFMSNDIINKTDCKCIKYNEIPNTECYWIEYAGSSISNGIILLFHGAAYVVNYAEWCFAEAELLSKLTGMIVISVKYRKAPKYSIRDAVDDGINVYKYFIKKTSSISLIGDSSGGGLTSLLLHKITSLNLLLPASCIIQNTWCYINYDAQDCDITNNKYPTHRENYKYDSFLRYPILNIFAKCALGLMDNNLNAIPKQNIIVTSYNPISYDFSALKNTAMYFMVGASDSLLYDTLALAKRAYSDGCKNIQCDIEPYMMHSWMVFVGKFPEADATVVRMAEFILNNINK